jgi:hypothetical protein
MTCNIEMNIHALKHIHENLDYIVFDANNSKIIVCKVPKNKRWIESPGNYASLIDVSGRVLC